MDQRSQVRSDNFVHFAVKQAAILITLSAPRNLTPSALLLLQALTGEKKTQTPPARSTSRRIAHFKLWPLEGQLPSLRAHVLTNCKHYDTTVLADDGLDLCQGGAKTWHNNMNKESKDTKSSGLVCQFFVFKHRPSILL